MIGSRASGCTVVHRLAPSAVNPALTAIANGRRVDDHLSSVLGVTWRLIPIEPRHRVVIVGGGFGGLTAAHELRRADVEVTVVDRTDHQLFQPLLYQVATGGLASGECASPIRVELRGASNTAC